MGNDSTGGDRAFTVQGSGAIFRNKSVEISRDRLTFNKSSRKEISCPLDDARLVEISHWQQTAGLIGPVTMQKLILMLRNGEGSLLKFGERHVFRVDDFTLADVDRLAEAIAGLRPDLLVVRKPTDLHPFEARALLSPPSGEWTCPHCGGRNPFPVALWQQQQARAAKATVVGLAAPTDVTCAGCAKKTAVKSVLPDLERAAREGAVKAIGAQKEGCFIATAVLDGASAPQLAVLRQFRDECLNASRMGRAFVRFYYRVSPPLAVVIRRRAWLRTIVRELLVLPSAAAVARLRSDRGAK